MGTTTTTTTRFGVSIRNVGSDSCLDWFGGRGWGLYGCHGGKNQQLVSDGSGKWCSGSHCAIVFDDDVTTATTSVTTTTTVPTTTSATTTSVVVSTTTTLLTTSTT